MSELDKAFLIFGSQSQKIAVSFIKAGIYQCVHKLVAQASGVTSVFDMDAHGTILSVCFPNAFKCDILCRSLECIVIIEDNGKLLDNFQCGIVIFGREFGGAGIVNPSTLEIDQIPCAACKNIFYVIFVIATPQ